MSQLSTDSKNIETIIMQIHLLTLFLSLSNVHENNCGETNGKAVIFDLAVPSKYGMLWNFIFLKLKCYHILEYSNQNIVNHYQEGKPLCVDTRLNMKEESILSKFWATIPHKKKTEIALQAISEWNLHSAIIKAKEETLKTLNALEANDCIIDSFDFDRYVDEVQQNVNFFLK